VYEVLIAKEDNRIPKNALNIHPGDKETWDVQRKNILLVDTDDSLNCRRR
jgi:hypothetical protein